MTTQYKIVPIDINLHKTIINHWKRDRDNLGDKSRFSHFPDDGYFEFAKLNPNHSLYDLIKFPIPYHEILYIRNRPRVGIGPVHLDSKRGCALNIPIEVNIKSSFIFAAREECSIMPGTGTTRHYFYEPEKYDFYNLRHPALINTQNPHGGANFADTHRVLLSVSFLEPYDYVTSHI